MELSENESLKIKIDNYSGPLEDAPPEPPSPITTEIIGVASVDISNRFLAIASDWPRSSAPMPG